MKGFILGIGLFLILAVTGTVAYMAGQGSLSFGTKNSVSPTPAAIRTQTEEETTQPLVGNDRDEHGCIGSAGYSWCEAKNKCLRVWEEPCDNSPSPTIDEAAVIIEAMKAAIIAKRGASASELNYTVSKIEGDYAKGGASGEGGGGMWFAAKVGGIWKLVWDGNGVILCSDLTAYPNFPTSFIPECYNETTQNTVKR